MLSALASLPGTVVLLLLGYTVHAWGFLSQVLLTVLPHSAESVLAAIVPVLHRARQAAAFLIMPDVRTALGPERLLLGTLFPPTALVQAPAADLARVKGLGFRPQPGVAALADTLLMALPLEEGPVVAVVCTAHRTPRALVVHLAELVGAIGGRRPPRLFLLELDPLSTAVTGYLLARLGLAGRVVVLTGPLEGSLLRMQAEHGVSSIDLLLLPGMCDAALADMDVLFARPAGDSPVHDLALLNGCECVACQPCGRCADVVGPSLARLIGHFPLLGFLCPHRGSPGPGGQAAGRPGEASSADTRSGVATSAAARDPALTDAILQNLFQVIASGLMKDTVLVADFSTRLILGSSKRFRWLSLAIDRHGDLDEGMRARVVDFVRDPSLGTPSPSSSSSSSVCSSDPGEGLDAGDALLRTADVHFRSGDGSRWPNVLLARFA